MLGMGIPSHYRARGCYDCDAIPSTRRRVGATIRLRGRSPTLLTHVLIGLILGFAGSSDPSSSSAPNPKPKPRPLVIKAGRLFDGTGDAHRSGQVIVIDGERIAAVGPADRVPAPDGADVIDLSGAIVLPGLIDAHTHIGSRRPV